MKVITIVGKKWFDKINGNTYHSATIYADDKVYNVPFSYGYGDMYIQNSFELLRKEGLVNLKDKESYWQWGNRNGVKINYESNYMLKRDL